MNNFKVCNFDFFYNKVIGYSFWGKIWSFVFFGFKEAKPFNGNHFSKLNDWAFCLCIDFMLKNKAVTLK